MKKKAAKKAPTMLIIAIIMLAITILWCIIRFAMPSRNSIDGSDNSARIAFINRCGWETGVRHTNVKSVKIPLSFDDTYDLYNDLQLRQGFDLRPYRAKYVKKYTFELTNCIGSTSAPLVNMYAHLLVCDGEIIGADICSAEENGLITVLVPPSMT